MFKVLLDQAEALQVLLVFLDLLVQQVHRVFKVLLVPVQLALQDCKVQQVQWEHLD